MHNNYYYHKEVTVYGKHNLTDATLLKNLYLQDVTRIKLHRGGYYDLYYSTNAGYHVVKSDIQYDLRTDDRYIVETV